MKGHAQALLLCVATMMIAGLESRAQETSPNDKLLAARVLYYVPTGHGLQSFHCTLQPDWKSLLTEFSAKRVKDNDPYLRFLYSVHLNVTDDLHGGGAIEWAAWTRPPPRYADAATKIHIGIQQTLSGFFDLWNAYMNGSMLPAPYGATLTEDSAGLRLHTSSGNKEFDETFDTKMLLTEVHLIQPGSDVTAFPKFLDTPDGRLVSMVRMEVREPPTSRPMDLTLHITYSTVSRFRLPHTLQYDLRGFGVFQFEFSDCAVQTDETIAAEP